MKEIPLIDQCGEIFDLGTVSLRCVLRAGHKGSHRASLNPVPVPDPPKPPKPEKPEKSRALIAQEVRS
jgi:hypothetical protein